MKFSRICFYKTDFKKHLGEMLSCLWISRCPDNLAKNKMRKVFFCNSTGSKSKSQESKRVPSIIKFHLKFKSTGQLLSKQLHILYMSQETKNFSMLVPVATFRIARKLSSFLVRANSYLIGQVSGSHKSKAKRYEVCLNVQEILCFTNSKIIETNKIKHQFQCNEKCVVYFLTCKNCLKYYVGQTI